MQTEVTRMTNLLTKPQYLKHHDLLNRVKRQWNSGEIDKARMKAEQLQSARDFQTHYPTVKERTKRAFHELGPMESLTLRKAARTEKEYEEALRFL